MFSTSPTSLIMKNVPSVISSLCCVIAVSVMCPDTTSLQYISIKQAIRGENSQSVMDIAAAPSSHKGKYLHTPLRGKNPIPVPVSAHWLVDG